MESFDLKVARTETASGWEWFLMVDGQRVYPNSARVGLFTGPEATVPEMTVRLLSADWPKVNPAALQRKAFFA